jgi:hypothetical protein
MTTDINAWPELPPGVSGTQIRYRKIHMPPMTSGPVRSGGAEPKVITAETRQHVIYHVYSSGGRDLGERCMKRAEFETEFERKEERPAPVDYVVSEARTIRKLPDDDFERVPCWTVMRTTDRSITPAGKYATKKAAEAVAAFLRLVSEHEMD